MGQLSPRARCVALRRPDRRESALRRRRPGDDVGLFLGDLPHQPGAHERRSTAGRCPAVNALDHGACASSAMASAGEPHARTMGSSGWPRSLVIASVAAMVAQRTRGRRRASGGHASGSQSRTSSGQAVVVALGHPVVEVGQAERRRLGERHARIGAVVIAPRRGDHLGEAAISACPDRRPSRRPDRPGANGVIGGGRTGLTAAPRR